MSGFSSPSFATLTNSLGANVALNVVANYFDGPSVAQGTAGKWLATGMVTVLSPVAGDGIQIKLWDGTTIIDSGFATIPVSNFRVSIALSGVFTSPAGNIRISARGPNNVGGIMTFNDSGNSKDSTITVVRIG